MSTVAERAPARVSRKPLWQQITKRQREQFLELVRDGMNRSDAASELGLKARAFKALTRFDPAFAEAYAGADDDRRDAYRHKLAKAREKLVDEGNGRMIHNESLAYDPDYRAAHQRTLVEMTGAGGGPIELRVGVTFPQLAEQLRQRLAAPDGGAVEGGAPVVELARSADAAAAPR